MRALGAKRAAFPGVPRGISVENQQEQRRNSRGAPSVAMMQSADLRKGQDPAGFRRFDLTRDRRVEIKRLMRA